MKDDFEVKYYTVEHKSVDSIGPNEYKEKLELFFKRYENEMLLIRTNIETIKHYKDRPDDIKILIDYAPCFVKTAWLNMWHTAVIGLGSILANRKNDKTSLFKFLDYIEENQKLIFTKEFYKRFIPDEIEIDSEIEWIKEEREEISSTIEKCRDLLDSQKENIEKILTLRDRLYAHFDVECLEREFQKKILGDVTIDSLDELADAVQRIYSLIHEQYDNSTMYLKYSNCDDIAILEDVVRRYDRYKAEILEQERERIMSGKNE